MFLKPENVNPSVLENNEPEGLNKLSPEKRFPSFFILSSLFEAKLLEKIFVFLLLLIFPNKLVELLLLFIFPNKLFELLLFEFPIVPNKLCVFDVD